MVDTYRDEDGENTEVDDREMRADTEGQGELAHTGDILHEITRTVTEYGGQHREEGEEKGWPAVEIGHEEVVDMDTTLGSEEKVHEEYDGQDSECEDWFEW